MLIQETALPGSKILNFIPQPHTVTFATVSAGRRHSGNFGGSASRSQRRCPPASTLPQAFKSVIRMIATTLPGLDTCSFVSLLQVHTKFFLAVKVLPSCSTRSSPSVIWQTMGFIIGGPIVFDAGCMMTSRIETVLKPGMMDGVSPSYARTTTPGHGVVSL